MRGARTLAGMAAIAVVAGSAWSVGAQEMEVPEALAVPEGNAALFALAAEGVQIYDCAEDPAEPGTLAWVFREPEADLFNAVGERVGSHYAGPTWEASDGSTVVGEVVERADADEADAIPLLLLEAAETTGEGVLSTVTYVQRLGTIGGAAPTEGCDEANEGEELRVDYAATYVFAYPAAAPATPEAATPVAG